MRAISVFMVLVFVSAGIGLPRSYAATLENCVSREPAASDPKMVTPRAPPQLRPTAPQIDLIGCRRAYRYRGVVHSVDSYNRRDAENLRPTIENVEAAVAELDNYQRNRRNAKIGAYVGSLGLALVGASLIRSLASGGQPRDMLGNVLLYGGIGVAVGGFGFGFAILRTNESHIDRAVERFNEARPEDPIELLFQTTILF